VLLATEVINYLKTFWSLLGISDLCSRNGTKVSQLKNNNGKNVSKIIPNVSK
jgi:hypothetical protein